MVTFVITSIAKIYARQIHKGNKTIADVKPESFQDVVRGAYLELYRVPCPEVKTDEEE